MRYLFVICLIVLVSITFISSSLVTFATRRWTYFLDNVSVCYKRTLWLTSLLLKNHQFSSFVIVQCRRWMRNGSASVLELFYDTLQCGLYFIKLFKDVQCFQSIYIYVCVIATWNRVLKFNVFSEFILSLILILI